MNEFRPLINQKVERLFIILWPPFGEEKLLDVDMSIGFVFAGSPHQLCVITTGEDAWTPCVRYEAIPNSIFDWELFDLRVKNWMGGLEMGDFGSEYYEITHIDIFKHIVSHITQSIEFVAIQDEDPPFGVRILFEDDFVLVTPISDGSTVETSHFNRNNNISVFEKKWNIEYRIV